MSDNKIKLGVFGGRRGLSYSSMASRCDAQIVAICDFNTAAAENLREKVAPDAAIYADFDEFISQDMDAVILCNYFDEHAPFAIRAMKAGKHVMSECVSNITVAEGVALCRAVEETGKIYKLAENYPYFVSNMDMRRVYRGKTLGNVLYAEGEYVHPVSAKERNRLGPGEKHWRNWIPATYYITHALAPLMYITDAMPTEVNARAVYSPELAKGTAVSTGDAVGITLCTMDNGALYRVTGWANMGGHGNWYRLACTNGSIESVRGNPGQVALNYNKWSIPDGASESTTYQAQWPSNAELAASAGHGGGDFWVVYNFIQSIKNNTQPYFNVYRAVAASTVGLMAWRSVLSGGAPIQLPDFTKEESRVLYENDIYTANPFADIPDEYRLSNSTTPGVHPYPADLEAARRDWAEMK